MWHRLPAPTTSPFAVLEEAAVSEQTRLEKGITRGQKSKAPLSPPHNALEKYWYCVGSAEEYAMVVT